MGRELFLDFFTEHEVPVIRKRRHTFLNMDDENVYVLKEGVVKVSRLLIIVKKIKLDIQKLLHPQKVEAITMDGKVVDTEVVNQIMAYFCSFIIIVGVLLFLVSFNNFDFETTVTSVMTCIGNVGPGYGLCGPMGNFSMFSDFSKIVLSFAMLIGRLEIYPIIIFLAPILNIRSVSKNIHSRKKRRSN